MQMVLLLFSPPDTASMVFEKYFHISIYMTTKQFYELWPRENRSASGLSSHVVSSLHETALTCICGLHGELCSKRQLVLMI